jgi:hypothetical protein
MKIKMDKISIEIKLSDKDNLKATATVDFGDITVKGFRLSVSEHENENLGGKKLWIQPPAIRMGNFWHKVVWLNDKEDWKILEKMIFDKYTDKQLKNSKEDEEIENLW